MTTIRRVRFPSSPRHDTPSGRVVHKQEESEMGKVCDSCSASYDRLANRASGVLADPWAGVWRDIVNACGCRKRSEKQDETRTR